MSASTNFPKKKILFTLYSFNIQAPPDLSHEQLFQFFIECNQDPDLHSPETVPPFPRATGQKASAKRKNISSKNTPSPLKKAKPHHSNQNPVQQRDDQILSALTSIQGVLSEMDERFQA
ncbi:hypothetical protein ABG768_008347 [Culter alburnus]|uniref:Uncharacterized protein n=1 Tax=Culter alburnus TaxID=194366 RepID=A0AAW1ZHU3_CULAL